MTTMRPRKAATAPITAGKGNWAVPSVAAAVVVPIECVLIRGAWMCKLSLNFHTKK